MVDTRYSTWFSTGTVAAASQTANLLTMPSHQAGDLLILVAESANQAMTISSNSAGWVQLYQDGTGTALGVDSTRLAVWWKIAESSSTAAPSVQVPSSDHIIARCGVLSGQHAYGSTPVTVLASGIVAAPSVYGIWTGGVTTASGTSVLCVMAHGTDTSAAQMPTATNSGFVTLTARMDSSTTTGGGGGIILYLGEKGPAGQVGTTSGTLATASTQAWCTLGVSPVPIEFGASVVPDETYYTTTVQEPERSGVIPTDLNQTTSSVIVPTGHILDAYTLALWRMDDEAVDSKLTITDFGTGAANLTAASESVAAASRPTGPGYRSFTRNFGSTTDHASAVSDATTRSILIGDHTFEAYVYITSSTTAKNIIAHSSSGESLATNYLTQWTIGATTGRQSVFWENGSGVNAGNAQTVGSGVPLNTWCHVAYTKTATTTTYWLNGTVQDAVATGAVAAGGTSNTWDIGTNEANSNHFLGQMAHVKLTSGVLSSGTLQANYALMNTTFDPPTGSAYHHWKMTDPGDTILDSSSYAVHLWPTTTTSVIPRNAALVQDGGYSIFMGSSRLYGYDATSNTPPAASGINLIRLALQDKFTFEGWYQSAEKPYQQTTRGFFIFGDIGTDTTATNFLSVYLNPDSTIGWNNEYGTGTTHSVKTSTYVLPDRNARYHVAVRGNPTVSGFRSADIFINGALVAAFSGINPYTGGTTETLYLGDGPTTGSSWYGTIDDVRISNIARADTEILESYKAGVGEAGTYIGGTYTVSGSWTNYTGDGSGITVNVYDTARKAWVASTTTVSGGHYSTKVMFNNRKYFAEAWQDATHLGRTDDGYPE